MKWTQISAFLITAAAVSVSAQSLKVNEKSFDFGKIDNVTRVTHRLTFSNVGTEPLNVRVKASCGCTANKVGKKRLNPGEDSYVDVSFNPAGRSGKTKKFITFLTNDPKNPSTRVTFTADIQPLWRVSPRRISFKYHLKKKAYSPESAKVTISNSGKTPISVDSFRSYNKSLRIKGELGKTLAPGEKSVFEISLPGDKIPPKMMVTSIVFKIKYGENKFHNEYVIMHADLAPVWKIWPIRCNFVFDEKSKTFNPEKQTVKISNQSDMPLVLQGVVSRNRSVTVTLPKITEIAPGKSLDFIVSPKKGKAPRYSLFARMMVKLGIASGTYSQPVDVRFLRKAIPRGRKKIQQLRPKTQAAIRIPVKAKTPAIKKKKTDATTVPEKARVVVPATR